MATQELPQRPKDEPTTAGATESKRSKKMAMAKRGLRSLILAIAIPLTLTILTHHYSLKHARQEPRPTDRHFWHQPSWTIKLGSATCAILMGLAAWLVWAEGGFHRRPAALGLYAAQLALLAAWAPLTLGAGAGRAGLLAAAGVLAATAGCGGLFRRVGNPLAGDLVKPCVAWAAFLLVISLKYM